MVLFATFSLPAIDQHMLVSVNAICSTDPPYAAGSLETVSYPYSKT